MIWRFIRALLAGSLITWTVIVLEALRLPHVYVTHPEGWTTVEVLVAFIIYSTLAYLVLDGSPDVWTWRTWAQLGVSIFCGLILMAIASLAALASLFGTHIVMPTLDLVYGMMGLMFATSLFFTRVAKGWFMEPENKTENLPPS